MRRSSSSRALRPATRSSGWISSRSAGTRCGTTSSGRRPRAGRGCAGAALKRGLEGAGGYGGDFATVLSSLRQLNRADVVLSTVDTVGIPLMLLARARVVRPPFVYAAIGLPERLVQLRSGAHGAALRAGARRGVRDRRLQRARGGRARGAGSRERGVDGARRVRALRGRRRGVPADERAARRRRRLGRCGSRTATSSCCSTVARALPETSFLVVTTADRARSLGGRPANVSVETDLPFDEMRGRLERARVVALPVRENSYSGATTVLLQAMALGKPVVVTRTAAIATGYGLEDGDNVRLVAPGDEAGFGSGARRGAPGRRAHGAGARRAGTGDGRGGAHVGSVRRAADRAARRAERLS